MFKHFIKLMKPTMKTKMLISLSASFLAFSSVNVQAQIRPPDISQSTSSVWTWRGKMKTGNGTPSITQTEGSFYVTSIAEMANSVYMTGLGGSGDKILYRNGTTGQISIITLNSTLGLTSGTLGVVNLAGDVTGPIGTSVVSGFKGFSLNGTPGAGTVGYYWAWNNGSSRWDLVAPSTGSVTSSTLTTNTIPKATGASAIGDSSLSDNGTTISTSENVTTSATVQALTDLLVSGVGANPMIYLYDGDVTISNLTSVFAGQDTREAGRISIGTATHGGMSFQGFTDTTTGATNIPLKFTGNIGATVPGTIPAISFSGFKWDGSTSRTALSGTEVIARFGTAFDILGSGALNAPGLVTSSTGFSGSGANLTSIPAGTALSGQVPIANGGTGAGTKAAGYDGLSPLSALGDTVYGGASGTGTRLAGNTTTTKKFYTQTGNGTISAIPSWSTIIAADVPLLPVTILDPTGASTGYVPTYNGSVVAWAAAGGSGRAPGVTKVVAASNSVVTTGADYICTGTDDQTQINSAITAASSVGGTVQLLEGTYTIANGAAATKNILMVNNVNIIGQGQGITIINRGANPSTTANGAMIYGGGSFSNIRIENLTMNGVKATYTNANNQGLVVTGALTGLIFRNVEMKNFVGDAFTVASGALTYSLMEHNNIHDNTGMGVDIQNAGLFRCQITNNLFDSNNRNISVGGSGSQGTVIEGNEFRNHAATADLYLNTPNSYRIIGNYFNGGSGGSAAVYMPGGQDGNVVAYNRFESPTGNAILFTSSGGHNVIMGNYISSSTSSGIYADGSGGTSNDDFVISDNEITGASAHGIELLGISNSIIHHNKIYNSGGSGSSSGIKISGNGDTNIFDGNSIFDTAGTGYAIDVNASTNDNNVLQGNRFSGTGATAINDAGTGTRWIDQFDGTNVVTKGVETRVKRVDASTGATAVVLGDVALSGWGTGATVAITAGSTDLAGTMTITAGTTPSANPTATLTYKDGAYKDSSGTNQSPFFMANWNTGSTGAAAQIGTSMTATTGVVTYIATPVNASTYVINWHTIGGR